MNADQSQDTTVHQLTGWMEGREAAEKKRRREEEKQKRNMLFSKKKQFLLLISCQESPVVKISVTTVCNTKS